MRYWARAIIGAWFVMELSCAASHAQSFGGWFPFRDDKKETFVTPPASLGASSADKATSTTASSATSPSAAPTANKTPPTPPSRVVTGGTPPATPQVIPDERTSFFPSMSWPDFQMPYFPKPQMPSLPRKQELDQTRNTWVQRNPEVATPSPWQAVTSGATRVKESTANAWRKSVDILTPGSGPEPRQQTRVAQREPSLWSRMLGSSPAESEGPKTVTEWMAQERIKP
jgi:hypothetical protein